MFANRCIFKNAPPKYMNIEKIAYFLTKKCNCLLTSTSICLLTSNSHCYISLINRSNSSDGSSIHWNFHTFSPCFREYAEISNLCWEADYSVRHNYKLPRHSWIRLYFWRWSSFSVSWMCSSMVRISDGMMAFWEGRSATKSNVWAQPAYRPYFPTKASATRVQSLGVIRAPASSGNRSLVAI